ncbi:MAG TPA: DUF2721 domain-containing protein [Vicinamibacteria bacterium]|nr:DUF2721 domain-containing protein [Vicinamibacteria bacterium]
MPGAASGLSVLSAMITPALLISACGTLILSTSNRLARIVDRVRTLSQDLERLWAETETPFAEERRAEVERQLLAHALRGRLVQAALTSFYVALGIFVATSISIGLITLLPRLGWLPAVLGITGTLVLFAGCVMLIRETRLAVASVRGEMAFALGLRDRYPARGGHPPDA